MIVGLLFKNHNNHGQTYSFSWRGLHGRSKLIVKGLEFQPDSYLS